MLHCKSDAFEAFKHFKKLAETEKGMKIKTLRSDRGGEFTSDEFSKYCLEQNGNLVAYDPRRHQDTIPRHRKSPFARADLSAYLYFFISLLWIF